MTALNVRDLTITYGRRQRTHAVRGVSFDVQAGRSVALIGESGSGKTSVARAVLGLVPVTGGGIEVAGIDRAHARRPERQRLHSLVQIVFQQPTGSLNPRMTVATALGEIQRLDHTVRGVGRQALREAKVAALEEVGLSSELLDRYPHQLSGGQRQRVALAKALIRRPQLLILDEATSALDVSVQAAIVNLLNELRRSRSLTYLVISHDLAVVAHLCEEAHVMLEGRIVESGSIQRLVDSPSESYTKELIRSIPRLPTEAPGGYETRGVTRAEERTTS